MPPLDDAPRWSSRPQLEADLQLQEAHDMRVMGERRDSESVEMFQEHGASFIDDAAMSIEDFGLGEGAADPSLEEMLEELIDGGSGEDDQDEEASTSEGGSGAEDNDEDDLQESLEKDDVEVPGEPSVYERALIDLGFGVLS